MQESTAVSDDTIVFQLYDVMNECLYIKHILPEIIEVADRLQCGVFSEGTRAHHYPNAIYRKNQSGRWMRTQVKAPGPK